MTSNKKKSHSTLFQNSKNGLFERVFDNQRLAIKQCYQTPEIGGKCQKSNVTF